MLPHPDTVCVLAAMDHRQLLAAGDRARRATEGASVGGHRTVLSGGIARLRAEVLGLARRQGGARPAVPDGTTAPALQ